MRFMKKIIMLISTLIFITSCLEPSNVKNKGEIVESMADTLIKQYPNVPVLKPLELIELQKTNQKLLIVDVRSIDEQKISMLKNAISKAEFEKGIKKFKSNEVVLYCTIGSRSSQYASKLLKQGYDAKTLKGGILAWANEGLEFMRKNVPTKRVHIFSEAWNMLPKNYEGVF